MLQCEDRHLQREEEGVQAFSLATDLVIFKLEKRRRAPKTTQQKQCLYIYPCTYFYIKTCLYVSSPALNGVSGTHFSFTFMLL